MSSGESPGPIDLYFGLASAFDIPRWLAILLIPIALPGVWFFWVIIYRTVRSMENVEVPTEEERKKMEAAKERSEEIDDWSEVVQRGS